MSGDRRATRSGSRSGSVDPEGVGGGTLEEVAVAAVAAVGPESGALTQRPEDAYLTVPPGPPTTPRPGAATIDSTVIRCATPMLHWSPLMDLGFPLPLPGRSISAAGGEHCIDESSVAMPGGGVGGGAGSA
jgi:hypothetical protein